MEDKKIQWHPGFVAAMNLELRRNRVDLIFEKEHNLNTKPLEIDLLVIKKETSAQILNEIGSFFRGHNIMEYKSPEDHLDIDSFYKAAAYACLYKAYGEKSDVIKADDITVSIIREAKPEELFRYFKKHDYIVSNPYKGIYYIESNVLFPTQIVVTKELDYAEHIWLGSLTGKMSMENMRNLLASIGQLESKADREFADSVLNVSVRANRDVIEKLKEEESMYEALMEIMEPQIIIREQAAMKAGVQQGVKQGEQQGIYLMVDALKDFGHSETEIKRTIMEKYNITEEEAEKYL